MRGINRRRRQRRRGNRTTRIGKIRRRPQQFKFLSVSPRIGVGRRMR